MQNNIRKAFVAALLAVAAFGVSLAAPGGAAPGMPRPPWAQPDGVATATSVKTTTARLGSLRRDDTVVVAVEGVVDGSGVDSNAVQGIVAEYCGTNVMPRVDAVESGLSDVEEWQRTNGLYSAVAELGDSVSAALAAKADGTVVERGVYSPAMDTNDVWVVDMDGTVLRFLDADPEAGTVTWRGVCASNTLWVSGSATSAPPEVAYSLTTLETGAGRVLASVDVVDAATGARCGIPRSTFDGAGTGVAYLAPSYDQAGPGDLQYSYTATVRPLGSGVLIFGRTDSGAFAEVMRFSRSRVVDAETSVVYDADLHRRLAELRAAVVSRDAATSGFTEWVVSAERPVTGEVVVAAFPAGSAPSGVCDWSLFYADDAVRDDSTRLADVKRASSAATNLVWAASETSWGISVTACRVRVPTVADIEGVQAVAGKHYDDASAMFAKLLHYATNNYTSAYLANKRAKDLEAWQYTNAVSRSDMERGMTDWAMTPMWPIGYVDAGQVLDGSDAGKWSLFPTGATHTASNALLPAIDGAKNSFGDVVELLWPDASWRVEERWTNSLDKLGLRWTPDPGNGYVTAHFDARAARTRVVTMGDVYNLSTNMAQTVTGLVGGVSERLDRLGADLASAARLSLPGECFPVTYMAGSSPPVTIGGADGLSFREDGGVVRMGDAASGRYICSFDPGTLRFLESPYGDALLFGRGYRPGTSNEWPVLSVSVRGTPVVPAGRTVNGKALTNDVTLTGADITVSGTDATKIDDALVARVFTNDFVQATNALYGAVSAELAGRLGNTGDQTLQSGILTINRDAPDGDVWLQTKRGNQNGIAVAFGGFRVDEYFQSLPRATGVIALLPDIYTAIQQIAPAFTGKEYALNELCTYNGVVYRCKIAYTAEIYNPKPDKDMTHWESQRVSELFLPRTGGRMTGDIIFSDSGARILQDPSGLRITDADGSHTWAFYTGAENAVARLGDLAGKLDKSGGTVTGEFGVLDPGYPDLIPVFGIDGTNSGSPTMRFGDSAGVVGITWHIVDAGVMVMDVSDVLGSTYRMAFPSASGTLALAAPSPTAGHLSALDANGNPTDSGIASSDVARKADIPTLTGQFMPETPTQNELAEAVKRIFVALGGTVTNTAQNVEAGQGLK